MKKTIQWTRGERIAGWSVVGGIFAIACLTRTGWNNSRRILDMSALLQVRKLRVVYAANMWPLPPCYEDAGSKADV